MRTIRLFVLFLSLAAVLTADVAVTEDREAGRLQIKGRDWEAGLLLEKPGLVYMAGGNSAVIVPLNAEGDVLKITGWKADQTKPQLEVTAETEAGSFLLLFYDAGQIRMMPGTTVAAVRLEAAMRFGVLPGLFCEDIYYDPEEYEGDAVLALPNENMVMGLLEGGKGILACAWPAGRQTVRLRNGADPDAKPVLQHILLELDGKGIDIGLLHAAGIWHREELKGAFLEQDKSIEWQRPFKGSWKTQLYKSNIETVFLFRDRRGNMWRPQTGFTPYPVWFANGKTWFHLTKKVPPEGYAMILPYSGHRMAPYEFIRKTLAGSIYSGRMKKVGYPKGPRKAPDIGYTHCWGTAMIKRTIFQYGDQKNQQAYLDAYVDHCMDYVAIIQQRNKDFLAFTDAMDAIFTEWRKTAGGNEDLQGFLETMQEFSKGTRDGLQARISNGGRDKPDEHIAYIDAWGARLKEVAKEDGTEFYAEAMHVLTQFNTLAAACDEGIPAGFGSDTREWFQEAARQCTEVPELVPYAEAIRKRIWEKLKCRNWETVSL